jgi:hypothetical protein
VFLPDQIIQQSGNTPYIPPQVNHELFERCLQAWSWCEKSGEWDTYWTDLLTRLSVMVNAHNPAAVQWESLMPRLFTHFLQVLDVAVVDGYVQYYNQCASPYESYDVWQAHVKHFLVASWRRRRRIPKIHYAKHGGDLGLAHTQHTVKNMARWIISLLPESAASNDSQNSCYHHLESLVRVLDPYFHPLNVGSWTSNLTVLLNALALHLSQRVREYNRSKAQILVDHALPISEQQQHQMVRLLLDPLAQMAFSKNKTMASLGTDGLKHLSWIAPEIVLPVALLRVHQGLIGAEAAFQTHNALELLASITAPLLATRKFADGIQQLMPLMFATLPAIDVNDDDKTFAAYKFYFIVLAAGVPLFDDQPSSNAADKESASHFDQNALECVPEFADWAMQFLDRVWQLMQQQDKPDDESTNQQQWLSDKLFQKLLLAFFAQLSPSLFDLCLDRTYRLVCAEAVPNAHRSVFSLISGAAAARPKRVLRKFLPIIRSSVLAKSSSDSEPKLNEHTSSALVEWFTAVLGAIVSFSGELIPEHQRQLREIIHATMFAESNAISDVGGQLLHLTLDALTTARITEYRSVVVPDGQDADQYLASNHWKLWGVPVARDLRNPSWFEPHTEHWRTAVSLADELLNRAQEIIEQTLALPTDSSLTATQRRTLWQAMLVLQRVASGGSQLLLEVCSESAIASTTTGGNCEIAFDQSEWHCSMHGAPIHIGSEAVDLSQFGATRAERRLRLYELLHKVAQYLLHNRTDDSGSMLRWCKAVVPLFDTPVVVKGQEPSASSKNQLYHARRLFYLLKAKWANTVAQHYETPRLLQLVQIELHNAKRREQFMFQERTYTAAIKHVLDDLQSMAINSAYSDVRQAAQPILVQGLKCFPKRWGDTAMELIGGIAATDKESHQLNGHIFTLFTSSLISRIVRNWRYIAEFVTSACRAFIHERPEIQTRIYHLFLFFATKFYNVPLAQPEVPESWHTHHVSEQCKTLAMAKRQQDNAKSLHTYRGLIDSIMDILNTPNLHWRYQV